MRRVLITGGTGTLGSAVVEVLARAGYDVRVMSRAARPGAVDHKIEWVQADLARGEGIETAVAGADVVVHAASSPFKQVKAVELAGVDRLLSAARSSGVEHFIYPSVVGIEHFPFKYYRYKVQAAEMTRQSGVPWTVQHFTQFYPFIERLLLASMKMPFMLLPTDFMLQPMHLGEAAAHVLSIIERGPQGSAPDMAGPQILSIGDMANDWLRSLGIKKRVVRLPLPGSLARAARSGLLTRPYNAAGRLTWKEWLEAKRT